MKESGYYPAGAEFDPNAPYNEPELEEITFPITISYALTTYSDMTTTNHEGGGVGYDEDGGYREPYHFLGSDNDARDEFQGSHKTPCQLLAEYAEVLKNRIKAFEEENNPKLKREIEKMKWDMADCLMWEEEFVECEVEDSNG